MKYLYCWLTGVLLASALTPAAAANDVNISFNQHPLQTYTGALLRHDWANLVWDGTRHRAHIATDGKDNNARFLRVTYPANTVGPEHNGGQFLVNLPPANEYYLRYRVRFQPGFDFAKGGKLPGLTSGGGKYSNAHKPLDGDGWTARLMWVEQGRLVPYLYYVGMPANRKFGDFWPIDAQVTPGKWQTITQRIRLNSPGKRDGIYSVWLDGKQVTHRQDMEWRHGDKGKIDSFYFSTYYGGNTPDWAPRWNNYIDFDDIRLSHAPLD